MRHTDQFASASGAAFSRSVFVERHDSSLVVRQLERSCRIADPWLQLKPQEPMRAYWDVDCPLARCVPVEAGVMCANIPAALVVWPVEKRWFYGR